LPLPFWLWTIKLPLTLECAEFLLFLLHV
jgi:hypothetical protein